MILWKILGVGTPLLVSAPSPEIAEAIACQEHGVDVSLMVTRRA